MEEMFFNFFSTFEKVDPNFSTFLTHLYTFHPLERCSQTFKTLELKILLLQPLGKVDPNIQPFLNLLTKNFIPLWINLY